MLDTLRPGLPKTDAVLLRLQLIGRMQATTLNNESVLPLGRKTRGLLAILALSGRRPVLRSKLAELLWSRRSEEQARASLRQEIHRLLEALSPIGTDIITVERHTLALKPALTSVDAERIRNANANQAESLPPIDGILLDELTGTDPALDLWLDQERTRLREHAIGLFETMLRRQRDTQGTLAAARQLLLLDGLHEGAWRAQIQGLLAQGETSLAFQSAQRCASAFAARNAIEPGPETRLLLSELLRGNGAGIQHDAAASPQSVTGASSLDGAASTSESMPPPLSDQPDGSAHRGAAPLELTGQQPTRFGEGLNRLRRTAVHGLPFVAVLPLLDLNDSAAFSTLAQGLAEDLVAGLIRYGGVKLLQGSELQESLAQGRDDAVLRRNFGLDYILDGTLQRVGGRIRVILRLTDIRQYGQIIWAQRFDLPEDNVLALQDLITTRVLAQLPWEIMLVESRRLHHRPAAELDSNGLVMRAVSYILRIDRIQNDHACALLRQSMELDNSHPLAHMIMSLAYLVRFMQRWDNPAIIAAHADTESNAVLERDPTINGGLTMSGLIRSEVHDEPEAALILLERALALHPSAAAGWAAMAFAQVRLGRLDEADQNFQHYKTLFPTHPMEVMLDQPGIMIPLLQGRFEDAARVGAVLVELRPGFAPNLVPYLAALGHLGRAAEADRIRTRLQTMLPAGGIASVVQGAGLRVAEHRQRLEDGLRLAGISLSLSVSDEPVGPLGATRRAG
ncbi:MAG: hypothetical protein ACRYGI_01035 [Janthinobacterium lividum]